MGVMPLWPEKTLFYNLVYSNLRGKKQFWRNKRFNRHLRIISNGAEKWTNGEYSALINIFKSIGNGLILLWNL